MSPYTALRRWRVAELKKRCKVPEEVSVAVTEAGSMAQAEGMDRCRLRCLRPSPKRGDANSYPEDAAVDDEETCRLDP